MPEISSASEATEIATKFLEKYYFYRKPLKAMKLDDTWVVEVDVGLFFTQSAKITIDARTGNILEYSVPPVTTIGK